MEISPVPSASQGQQNTAASGVDIISQLITAAKGADERAAKTAQAATVPISGGHIAPQQVNPPGAGHSYQQFQRDERPVTGKHQATMQGIANLNKSVANVVGQVTQMQDQKKTAALSTNIEQLMNAVSSSDQAKQVLAQDPNNSAAQEQLRKAESIQNEILGDDKNRKAISKAYNINFTDPSKNNTPEHAALKQATDSYTKQFQDKIPGQMAPNQQAIAAAQTAAAEAKATHDLVDKLAPAIIRAQASQNVADTRAQAQKDATTITAKAHLDAAQITAKAHLDAAVQGANIHVKGMLQAVNMRDETLIKTAQMKIDQLDGKDGKSPKAQQEAQHAFDSITKTMNTYQQQINLLEQNRKNADPKQVDGYDKQIQFFESQGKVLQLKQAELAAKLSSAGETPISTGSSAAGAAANYVSDTDDDDSDDSGEKFDQ